MSLAHPRPDKSAAGHKALNWLASISTGIPGGAPLKLALYQS